MPSPVPESLSPRVHVPDLSCYRTIAVAPSLIARSRGNSPCREPDPIGSEQAASNRRSFHTGARDPATLIRSLTHLDKRVFLALEDSHGKAFWNWSGFSLSWGGHTRRHLDIRGRQPTMPLPGRLILGLKS
jgi:hypothetical protein